MIKIAVVCYDNVAPLQPLQTLVGPERKTLGRSSDNMLVLPDPKHEVSRSQAACWNDGKANWLVNLSQATPMRINDQEIVTNEEVEIHVGDQIRIGQYLLQVEPCNELELQAGAAAQAAPQRQAQALALAPAPDAARMPAPAQAEPDLAALKAAFLRGAGIAPGTLSSELTPELMELIGGLLAASIQGTIGLIGLRSLVKQEVKADVTMVVVRNNNPLKFFPDSQTVLTQMLRKPMPGFMGPMESIEDAFTGLHAHQMGMVAGMDASSEAIVAHLNPQRLAAELGGSRAVATLLPVVHHAGLWKTYAQQYDSIVGPDRTAFQKRCRVPFLAAYEQEVERFQGGLNHG